MKSKKRYVKQNAVKTGSISVKNFILILQGIKFRNLEFPTELHKLTKFIGRKVFVPIVPMFSIRHSKLVLEV